MPLTKLLLAAILLSPPLLQNDSWKTGRDFDLHRKRLIDLVSWAEQPLGDGLNRLSENRGIAVFLDRRIDPSSPITAEFRGKSFDQIVMAIAEQRNLGVAIIGSTYYIGPVESAAAMPWLLEQANTNVARLPLTERKKWRRKNSFSWPRLSRPRDLLDQLATTNSLVIDDVQNIEHDLWPERTIPLSTRAEQLVLLLIGFDKSFTIGSDGRNITITDVRIPDSTTRKYTRRSTDEWLADLRKNFPDAQIKREKNSVHVTASPMAHYWLAARMRPTATSSPSDGKTAGTRVVSLEREAEIGSVLATVATALGVELKYDTGLTAKLSRRRKFSVSRVSYEELIRHALEGTGLKFELTESELKIRED